MDFHDMAGHGHDRSAAYLCSFSNPSDSVRVQGEKGIHKTCDINPNVYCHLRPYLFTVHSLACLLGNDNNSNRHALAYSNCSKAHIRKALISHISLSVKLRCKKAS